jgi:type VI secretion system protein ImpA
MAGSGRVRRSDLMKGGVAADPGGIGRPRPWTGEGMMASPEVIDLGKLLAAIPGDNPAGADLRADGSPGSAYYAIKDARSAARAAERQMIPGEEDSAPPPDWRPVLEFARKALAEKTKDLEIAAYLIEALVRQHGFAGLRDGFRLARGLVDAFWDRLYPLPDEDVLETRVAALAGLNGVDAEGTLIAPIALVPITEAGANGRLSLVHYQQAASLGKLTDPKVREKRIAQGAVTLEELQKAVAETPPPFYAGLVQDLTQCQEEFAGLCQALESRCGVDAPSASNIRTALTSYLDVVKDLARNKLDASPAKDGAATSGAPAAAGAGSPAAGPSAEAIQSREDAFRVLLKVADYFRRAEPHSVVTSALEQVVRWGQMPLPELLAELIPDEAPRKNLFKQVGIRPPESAPKEVKK